MNKIKEKNKCQLLRSSIKEKGFKLQKLGERKEGTMEWNSIQLQKRKEAIHQNQTVAEDPQNTASTERDELRRALTYSEKNNIQNKHSKQIST